MSENKTVQSSAPADYSEESRYNKGRAIVFALLKWLECEFFGVFIFLMLFALRVVLGRAGDIIFGLLGLITYVMVMADFGWKEGNKAHIKNAVRGDKVERGFGALLGAVSIVPPLITLGVLGLSYSGAIGSAVFAFKALNAGLWGIINLFVSDMEIAHLSAAIFGVFPLVQLIIAGVTAAAFGIGLSGSDLQTKLLYKNGGK